jgi:hypothetical protein
MDAVQGACRDIKCWLRSETSQSRFADAMFAPCRAGRRLVPSSNATATAISRLATNAADLASNQPSLAKRVKAAAPEPNRRRRAIRPASYGSTNKIFENNPMQRKEPLEKKGVAGMDIYPAKTF